MEEEKQAVSAFTGIHEKVKKKRKKKTDYPKDASNNLSYTKMKKRVEKMHPRTVVGGERKPYPLFRTSTGFHSCFENHKPEQKCRRLCCPTRETDLKEFGVGVSLYFKFLKSMLVVWFLVFLLQIPSIAFNVNGNPNAL